MGLATTRLADLPTCHIRAEGGDRTAKIRTEDMREGQVQPAPTGAHEIVQPVERCILHPDQYLAGRWFRGRDIFPVLQHFRAAMFDKRPSLAWLYLRETPRSEGRMPDDGVQDNTTESDRQI